MTEAGGEKSSPEISMEFHLPAELSALRDIRRHIVELAREYQVGEEHIAKIEISVDEACANVMQHAYGPEQKFNTMRAGALIVIVRILADRVEIEVIDQGVGELNGSHQGVSDLVEYVNLASHSGLGLYIIAKCMDDYQVAFPDRAGTHLSMMKYVDRPA